jgi:hypothetical protein
MPYRAVRSGDGPHSTGVPASGSHRSVTGHTQNRLGGGQRVAFSGGTRRPHAFLCPISRLPKVDITLAARFLLQFAFPLGTVPNQTTQSSDMARRPRRPGSPTREPWREIRYYHPAYMNGHSRSEPLVLAHGTSAEGGNGTMPRNLSSSTFPTSYIGGGLVRGPVHPA